MIRMSHSIPDARAVAIHTDLGAILITGDYKFDQTPVDGEPRRHRAARRARPRGSALPVRRLDERRPPGRRALGVERRPGAARAVRAAARGGSSSPASPPTSTASSRSSTPPPSSTARSRSSAARCARTSTSPPNLGIANAPERPADPAQGDRGLPRREGRSRSRPAARASRSRRCAGWRTATTATSSSTPATPSIFSATPVPGNERSVNETIDRIFEIGAKVITAADAPDPRLRPRLSGGAEADAQPDASRGT